MTKDLIERVKEKDVEQGSGWLLKEIITDPILQSLWQNNYEELDNDEELDFTEMQKKTYLLSKTLLMEAVRIWGGMTEDERKTAILDKDSIYGKIDKYIKRVTDLEDKARKRFISMNYTEPEKIDNPFKNAKKVSAEYPDGSKIEMKRGDDFEDVEDDD